MRQRTKMKGLVSHTYPDGKSCTSAENKCRCGINKLQKLLDEGYEIAGIKKHEGNPKEVIVSLFGGQMKMTFTEYQERGKGLKVLMEIF